MSSCRCNCVGGLSWSLFHHETPTPPHSICSLFLSDGLEMLYADMWVCTLQAQTPPTERQRIIDRPISATIWSSSTDCWGPMGQILWHLSLWWTSWNRENRALEKEVLLHFVLCSLQWCVSRLSMIDFNKYLWSLAVLLHRIHLLFFEPIKPMPPLHSQRKTSRSFGDGVSVPF